MKLEPLSEIPVQPEPLSVLSNGRMGELFIQAGKLTREQVDQVIQLQETTPLRFGEAAVRLHLLSDHDIQAVLARQFDYVTASDLRVGQEPGCPLPIANAPYSPEAEAIRRIRSEILLEAGEPRTLRLALVSPGAEEGRSYLAANLAFSFAQLDKRTLLIDADFRQPSLHGYFGMSNKKGLSSVLSGRSEAGFEVMTSVLPKLVVLPAGPLPPNPLEVLRDPGLSRLIDRLAVDFDVVLVDTPPATDSSDSKVIARQVGAALVIGREDVTRVTDLRQTADDLQSVGVHLMGTVYNQLRPQRSMLGGRSPGWWSRLWRRPQA
ncbi:MAG: polysaccharide biosynthesis tyrosine autokinase [Curvibacter sp.]|nr:polysaccharide biosynthesis tyrosine autokinase [Curvibacter sp.]